MVMNLYILILISFPEALLNLYITLQLINEGKLPSFREKKNLIRFFISLSCMLLFSWVVRPLAPNAICNMIFHSIGYMLIISLVYWVNIFKSACCVSAMLLLYSTVENSYIHFIIAYISKGMDNFSRDYTLYIFYSLPSRIAQFVTIRWLKKYRVFLSLVKLHKSFYKLFAALIYGLVLVQYSLSFIADTYFDKMELIHQIVFSVSITLFVFLSSYILLRFMFGYMVAVLKSGNMLYQQAEGATLESYKGILSFLQQNDVDSAKKSLESLIAEKEKKLQQGNDIESIKNQLEVLIKQNNDKKRKG